ncbi:MAG: Arc family DNA-binding protein [Thermacetogeniaceae bacterium]
MPSNLPRFTIRISRMLLKKISYIAEENGRSANKEVEQLIKKYVSDYEKENGVLKVEE